MAEALYGIASSLSDDKNVEIPVFYLQLALALDPQNDFCVSLLADRMEIAKRWDDPSFPHAYPNFKDIRYWMQEYEALAEIAEILT